MDAKEYNCIVLISKCLARKYKPLLHCTESFKRDELKNLVHR